MDPQGARVCENGHDDLLMDHAPSGRLNENKIRSTTTYKAMKIVYIIRLIPSTLTKSRYQETSNTEVLYG